MEGGAANTPKARLELEFKMWLIFGISKAESVEIIARNNPCQPSFMTLQRCVCVSGCVFGVRVCFFWVLLCLGRLRASIPLGGGRVDHKGMCLWCWRRKTYSQCSP